MEMIHYLRPPFLQIPPDEMLAIIQTATCRYPSPILDEEEAPPLNQEQPRHEPHPNVVFIPNAEDLLRQSGTIVFHSLRMTCTQYI
jgi:hypothetical protein